MHQHSVDVEHLVLVVIRDSDTGEVVAYADACEDCIPELLGDAASRWGGHMAVVVIDAT